MCGEECYTLTPVGIEDLRTFHAGAAAAREAGISGAIKKLD
jgi:hypothetical protein